MNPEIFNDELTNAIHDALCEYARDKKVIHLFKALGEIICKGERTAENRLTEGGWTVEELKAIVTVMKNEKLNAAVKQYLSI